MAEIWVKQFTGGLDSRRMPETTTGGVLLKAQDGHITRGGEFEKRAAFVETYDLPPGTLGMAQNVSYIVTFGSSDTPGAHMPDGTAYQRLQHPDGVTPLVRMLSYDLYAGLIYAVGEFEDGTRHHFYDGNLVAGWFDGRARASFAITAGQNTGAAAAYAVFRITGGTVDPANTLQSLTIDGVATTNGTAIPYTTNNAATAALVAAAINGFTSIPDYTAAASGNEVRVTATTAGAAQNGFVVVGIVTGDVTTSGDAVLHDGANGAQSTLNQVYVNGSDILGAPVAWAGSNNAMAAAVAAQINTYASSPENFTATSVGNEVNILAPAAAAADNGKTIFFGKSTDLGVSPSATALAGGADTPDGTYLPGDFVKTIGSKMYSTSGPNCFFSGVQQPTQWTTDAIGAGFIDMSAQASGSEQLVALAKYNKYVAVFAGKITQIWYMDPDPAQNQHVQDLNNTGTFCPRSVTQFGDSDLFYLDESGLRSLRARDASNAASTTDVGVPIDTIIIDKLNTISAADRQNVFGCIEPQEGRFWLSILDTIYVFSFFSGAGVAAWTTYVPGFPVDSMVVHNQRVFVRSGDKIYVYGGLGTTKMYDDVSAVAWLPYLDGDAPTQPKDLDGIDAALTGLWDVSMAMEPTQIDTEEMIATLGKTTFNGPNQPAQARATHFSPRFRSRGTGPAKLAAVVLHYRVEGEGAE